jgi:rod shape-determining protein MreC
MSLTSAEHNPSLFRGAGERLRFLLIALLCITLMFLDHRNDHLVSIRKSMAVMVQPIVYFINAPSNIGHWIADNYTTRKELKTQNRQLKEKMLISKARLQKYAALETENARLRGLLKSTEKISNGLLIAELITVDMSPFRQAILINKGSNDGIQIGEALIDSEGVIGQIIRDRIMSSEALLITDADHALPVELLRNRLRSIAVGTGEIDRLSMPFLPRNADIIVGDVLVTSGLGGTFPPGYPVGIITRVESKPGQPFLEINAKPIAMLNRIREVLVVQPERMLKKDAAYDKETN